MSSRTRMNRRRSLRRGFTLLELMLVMAILVLMSSLAVVAVLNLQRNANSDAAMTQINTLKTACKMYKLNVGRFPASLNDLAVPPSGMTQQQWRGPYLDDGKVPVDPWGSEFQYSADESTDRVLITSKGADGQPGTPDDVPGPTAN